MSVHINIWVDKKDNNKNVSYSVEDVNGNYINANNCTTEEKDMILFACSKIINSFT